MNIGTKANAIDDLGKLDGNKMTIKVDGKQIYPQKRYAIVRVDEGCPIGQSVFKEIELQNVCNASKSCSSCLLGDTKEQLVRKVAQVLFIRKMKAYKKILGITPKDKKDLKQVYEKCLETAKEIVEFLGVE